MTPAEREAIKSNPHFYPFSGNIVMPRNANDQKLFDSGRESYLAREPIPFPGADVWGDMMTNQGWIAASREDNP